MYNNEAPGHRPGSGLPPPNPPPLCAPPEERPGGGDDRDGRLEMATLLLSSYPDSTNKNMQWCV